MGHIRYIFMLFWLMMERSSFITASRNVAGIFVLPSTPSRLGLACIAVKAKVLLDAGVYAGALVVCSVP